MCSQEGRCSKVKRGLCLQQVMNSWVLSPLSCMYGDDFKKWALITPLWLQHGSTLLLGSWPVDLASTLEVKETLASALAAHRHSQGKWNRTMDMNLSLKEEESHRAEDYLH